MKTHTTRNDVLQNLPDGKRQIVEEIATAVSGIAGVQAVVLAGSYARGTARPDSDVDLGIYYREQSPFSVGKLRQVVEHFDVNESPTVTDFYEWGPWVNGGAWIATEKGRVDLLYRNIDHIKRVIAEARQGRVEWDYWQQPTYGFHNVIYLAETGTCLPIYDPQGMLEPLKEAVATYPQKLKKAIVNESLWGAQFTLSHAKGFARRGDVYNAVGCVARVLCHLTQGLFALNEVYFISDKNAIESIESFTIRPANYGEATSRLLGEAGVTSEELVITVEQLASLVDEVVGLAQNLYRPKYSW
jgi:predicted nucleotidyltransferase